MRSINFTINGGCMSTIQIDPDVLIKAMTAAIQAAVVQVTPDKPKAKRGRPPKKTGNGMCPQCSEAYMYCACENNPLNNTEITSINDDVDQIIKEAEAPLRNKPSDPNIFRAKISNRGLDSAQATVEVKKKPGDIKFMDISNVGDRIPADKYPEPTERRPPVNKMKFDCDRCNRPFEAYPSEIPQAFINERITGVGEGKPRVLCENCIGK